MARSPLRRRIKRLRRHLVFYILRAAYRILRVMPRAVLQTIVSTAAPFAYLLDRRDREIMRRNLSRAFPGRRRAFRERVARGVFLSLGRGAADMVVASRHPGEKIARRVPVDVDWEHHGRLWSARGAVIVSGHVGCWELLAASISQYLPGKIGVVARRLYFPPFNEWVVRTRESFALQVFYQDESPRRVVRFLRERNVLGILPDQDIKGLSGVFVPFFGHDAWTPTGPAALALTTGVPVFVTYLVWDGDAYRLRSEGPLPFPRTGSRARDLRILTETWTRILERVIRAYPDQWVWFHRRWRTRVSDPADTRGV